MARAAVAYAVLFLAGGCAESESAREERAMKAATPQRVQADGTIRLSEADRTALGLVVAPAEECELPDTAIRYGRVRARLGEDALVVAPVSGRIPNAATVQLGQPVDAGAPLLDLIPVLAAGERVALGVQSADLVGQLEATARELKTRELEAGRARELAQSNIVSAASLEMAETAVATTRARFDALRRARGVQSRGEGGAMTLHAPVAGTLVTIDAPVGAIVRAGDILARIIKPGPRWVDVAVPPNDPAGERYEVESGSGWVPARLVSRGAVVEEDGTRHDRLEIEAAQATSLVPGGTVPVRVARPAARGVVVLESAVVPGVGADLVYLETGAGTFAARSVRIGARFGGRARVSSGLSPGDKVVVQGAMGLRGESLRGELRHVE